MNDLIEGSGAGAPYKSWLYGRVVFGASREPLPVHPAGEEFGGFLRYTEDEGGTGLNKQTIADY